MYNLDIKRFNSISTSGLVSYITKRDILYYLSRLYNTKEHENIFVISDILYRPNSIIGSIYSDLFKTYFEHILDCNRYTINIRLHVTTTL